MKNTYNLVEYFISLNGESQFSGKRSLFIRFAGCNLRCTYCDTSFSWKYPNQMNVQEKNQLLVMTGEEINQVIKDSGVKYVCVTGGEPLSTKEQGDLIKKLASDNKDVMFEVETNGAIDISKNFGDLVFKNIKMAVDYKSLSSGMNHLMRLQNWDILREDDIIKFVIGTEEDLDHAIQILKKHRPISKIYFSPMEGEGYMDKSVIWNRVADERELDITVQLQLHKYFFDPNLQGV